MTDKDDISRHSFKRRLGEPIEMSKNQFGQTVLGDTEESGVESMDIAVNPQMELRASVSILNSSMVDEVPRVLKDMMNALPDGDPQKLVLAEQLEALELNMPEPINEYTSKLMNAVDKLQKTDPDKLRITDADTCSCMDLVDRDDNFRFLKNIMDIDEDFDSNTFVAKVKLKNTDSDVETTKLCNKCKIELFSQAKFCTACGASQIVKFCTQCGYHFGSEEKFCPECGTQR